MNFYFQKLKFDFLFKIQFIYSDKNGFFYLNFLKKMNKKFTEIKRHLTKLRIKLSFLEFNFRNSLPIFYI
jgi:hypothetical protein